MAGTKKTPKIHKTITKKSCAFFFLLSLFVGKTYLLIRKQQSIVHCLEILHCGLKINQFGKVDFIMEISLCLGFVISLLCQAKVKGLIIYVSWFAVQYVFLYTILYYYNIIDIIL